MRKEKRSKDLRNVLEPLRPLYSSLSRRTLLDSSPEYESSPFTRTESETLENSIRKTMNLRNLRFILDENILTESVYDARFDL